MSFLKSAINQVGRDMGRVISNQIFKDAHSTPYRRAGSRQDSQVGSRQISTRTEFEKSISFHTGYRPPTLINKLSGAYTEVKNEANYYISDGYLDTDEADSLFSMMEVFNSKVGDVYDVLEIDEEGNRKELQQLEKLLEKTNSIFKEVLVVASKGSEESKEYLLSKGDDIENLSFGRFVGLNAIWMRKYALTGEKKLIDTILANFFSIICACIPNIIMAFYGAISYRGENKNRVKQRDLYYAMADLEGKRAEAYMNIVNQNPK